MEEELFHVVAIGCFSWHIFGGIDEAGGAVVDFIAAAQFCLLGVIVTMIQILKIRLHFRRMAPRRFCLRHFGIGGNAIGSNIDAFDWICTCATGKNALSTEEKSQSTFGWWIHQSGNTIPYGSIPAQKPRRHLLFRDLHPLQPVIHFGPRLLKHTDEKIAIFIP